MIRILAVVAGLAVALLGASALLFVTLNETEGKLATTAVELEETASSLVEQTALTVELEGAKRELEGKLATTAVELEETASSRR